jgi:hypothetical protein
MAMAAAAEALQADYLVGGELTAFTSLDSEDFQIKIIHVKENKNC